ncbi:hypothetical protein CXG81DRAFT_5603, partial [Caulochytrium protostelioides]
DRVKRKYQCQGCPRRFRRSEHLGRHVRTHDLVKPFPCPICLRSFARADALKRHAKVHR